MFHNKILPPCSRFPSISSCQKRNIKIIRDIIKNKQIVNALTQKDFEFPRIKAPQFRLKNTPFTWMPEKEREVYAKFLQHYIYYDYFWNQEKWAPKTNKHIVSALVFGQGFQEKQLCQAVELDDTPVGLIRDKILDVVPISTNDLTINFFSEDGPPADLIESMAFHYHCSDWAFTGNFYVKNVLNFKRRPMIAAYEDVMQKEDIEKAAKEAFGKIIQALYKKDFEALSTQMAPFTRDMKIIEVHKSDNGLQHENLSNPKEEYLEKLKSKLERMEKNHPENFELLNMTSDDVLFIPETNHGNIFWDIRKVYLKTNMDRIDVSTKAIIYTVPIVALYKKKILYDSVRHKPLTPRNSIAPYVDIPEAYGYGRPLRIVGLLQFLNEMPRESLSTNRMLFGFHIQVPKVSEESEIDVSKDKSLFKPDGNQRLNEPIF